MPAQLMNDRKIKGLILDMDGVIWRSTEPIGNLPQIFSKLSEIGMQVTFATNNATRDEQQYVDKLASFGVQVNKDQIVNSCMATSHRLIESYPDGGPLYIIGESGLINTLERAGFYHSENMPLAVVVGMDRAVDYEKMGKAAILIRKGVPFYGTNPDKSFPTPEGQTIGTGAILAAIEAATDVSPIICGKPFPDMMYLALEKMNITADEALVVGDRYETDIIGGINANCQTVLVLSGVTSAEKATSVDPQPDIIMKDLTELVEKLIE